jgi:NAD(P)H dehydrogenase (quinone)
VSIFPLAWGHLFIMANILIVHAHHEPRSFSSALAKTASETLAGQGHEIVLSDLYAMNFNPVSDRRNFTTVADPTYLKQQNEEGYASEHGGFVSEIESEMRKIEKCDLLIFSFPLWWFGMPAILKGWVDRVFACGRIYGRGHWERRIELGETPMRRLKARLNAASDW